MDDAERRTLLSKNAYTPKMLAEELDLSISEQTIRRAVRTGKLKARRLGGRYIVILRTDAEEWLNSLPLPTESTARRPVPKRVTNK